MKCLFLPIYQEIYVIEQWFRRIAYADIIAKYGKDYTNIIPSDLLKGLKASTLTI